MNISTTNKTEITPSIYIACLASYNNGILHGKWIELDQDIDDVQKEIQTLLQTSPIENSEEYAIHDYEGFFGYSVSEYENIESLVEFVEMIQKYGEAYVVLIDYMGSFESTTEDVFNEVYQGQWDSEVNFTEQIADEIMEIPKNISFYFDYEKFSNDLFINDYLSVESSSGGYHIFRRY